MLVLCMMFALVACGGETAKAPAKFKVGMGHNISAKMTDATADKAGSAQVDTTMLVAAFDAEGKVTSVSIDVAQQKLGVNADGTTADAAAADIRTKIEKEGDYGMVGASGIGKEYFEQIEALENWMVGKTVEEIVNMPVMDRGDGSHTHVPTDADLAAGCTITVKASSKAKADYPVVLKDKNGNEVTGTTDENGVIILPGEEHSAYIFGYNDGSFRPDNDMTRSEAAAIFARLIAEEKGETVSGKATFSDVKSNDWCYKYIGYLEKYDIIKGYSDGTFRPDDAVTRAEFVTMAVRYYALFNEVKKSDYTVNYTDLTKSYWAYSDIAYAKHIGWLNGYADGTFKGDNNITRAEVVTVTNHATERTPDEDYINKNVSTLNKFTDLKNNSHWAYYDIMEAANTHLGVANKDAENWVK